MNDERELIQLDDLTVSMVFPSLRIDSDGRDDLGQYVQELEVEARAFDTDQQKDVALGHLDCFLFDAVSAESDHSLWPEADYESTACEFYEFLFLGSDWLRGGLMHKLFPEQYDVADEVTELCNVLCVSMGWWGCRPDVLAHVIARLQRSLHFEFVCVDTEYIHDSSTGKRGHRALKPMRLPTPFRKIMWRDTTDPDDLVDSARERFFWVAPLYGTRREKIRQLSDETTVLPLKVVQ